MPVFPGLHREINEGDLLSRTNDREPKSQGDGGLIQLPYFERPGIFPDEAAQAIAYPLQIIADRADIWNVLHTCSYYTGVQQFHLKAFLRVIFVFTPLSDAILDAGPETVLVFESQT